MLWLKSFYKSHLNSNSRIDIPFCLFSVSWPCQSSYPAFPCLNSFHVADCPFVGPFPSDELEEMANPLPPPKRGTGLAMLYHSLGLLGVFGQVVIPWQAAVFQGHLWDLVFLPWPNSIFPKVDWDEWVYIIFVWVPVKRLNFKNKSKNIPSLKQIYN